MPPALIAGGIAAVGAIGGALISSHATSSAASQANEAQQQATQAQVQLGQQSLALNKDIYNSNYNVLSPWVSRGNVAGDAYSALLGLPTAPAMHSPLEASATPVPTGTPAPPPVASNATPTTGTPAMMAVPTNALAPNNGLDDINAQRAARGLPPVGGGVAHPPPTPAPAPAPVPAGTPPPTTAHAPAAATPTTAMQDFANSAGMQFQLQQGANAINNLYAAHGQLQSGAAAKAIQNYGQQTALNNYFMPYMSMVNGVSAQGAQAGSAIAGVGSSFGNTAAGINGQIGNAYQNGADSTSNAAIANGYGQAQLWNSAGQAIGNIASSYYPR